MKCLLTISGLPSRQTSEGKLDLAVYMLSLEGVTRLGIGDAVRRIIQGELGHAFMPSPPELRQMVDKVMQPHIEARQRADHQKRINEEREPPVRPKSPEEKARVAALLARFHESYDKQKNEELLKERAEIRQRYGMTPDVLAGIPDAKDYWKRVGEK